MRREPTFTERALWTLLRNRRLAGLKFRRQVPIGDYVVDFLCFSHHLVVEADGPMHDPHRDAVRDAWLRSKGLRVLRFPNGQITLYPDSVLDEICKATGRQR
jgi:very-short-patch-repair endonuclease